MTLKKLTKVIESSKTKSEAAIKLGLNTRQALDYYLARYGYKVVHETTLKMVKVEK